MDETPLFEEFAKISRLNRPIVITEKIDGTNGQIYIPDLEPETLLVGSRNRWITPGKNTDNNGFAAWAYDNKTELLRLGPGRHYGEWWGRGIQRGYGLTEKRFSLFNTHRWSDPVLRPACCSVVPVLWQCDKFDTVVIAQVLADLAKHGSAAAPGFMKPEGIVIFHEASGHSYKVTIEGDDVPKSVLAAAKASGPTGSAGAGLAIPFTMPPVQRYNDIEVVLNK